MSKNIVRVPKPTPAKLPDQGTLSVVLRDLVSYYRGMEATLPPDQQTGIDARSVRTDTEAGAYLEAVTERFLLIRGASASEEETAKSRTKIANSSSSSKGTPGSKSSKWVLIAGLVFGSLTFVFFTSLVIASMLGKSIPPESRLLVVAVLAIGIALSAGFIGGTASASGKIPFPSLHPFSFSVAGGTAVFIIVFLIGYWTYVKTPDVSVKLTGTVTDADAVEGIPGATVIIKTDDRTYEKQTSETGDFYVADVPDLFNKQVVVSVKADNYIPSNSQTVLIGSAVQSFKFQLHNCYNGIWHEIVRPARSKGRQWRFKASGTSLHIFRMDGFVSGDFRRGLDGTWTGDLSWSGGEKTTGVILNPPDSECNQIVTNRSWSYERDSYK